MPDNYTVTSLDFLVSSGAGAIALERGAAGASTVDFLLDL